MKKFKVLTVLLIVVFMAGMVFAETPSTLKRNTWNAKQWFNQEVEFDGNVKFDNTVDFTGSTVTATGLITATHIADVVRYFQLPIMSFTTNGEPITASTAPGLEVDDLIPGIVWADGETTPLQVSFRVPDDYASGGAFKVLATESDSTIPNQVDFSVYVNASGTTADSSATNQTPVALAGTTSTPDEITLTVAADFAGLAAGNWVTLNIWRDDVATGTGDLEIKGVVFYYTATQ